MREIKFRAWDSEKKEMLYFQELFGKNVGGIHWNNPNGTVHGMQFTGILDKNWKDIYEGDIIIFDNILPRRNTPFVVQYIKGMFCIENPILNFEYCPLAFIVDTPHVEIIGNIYENPELINNPE